MYELMIMYELNKMMILMNKLNVMMMILMKELNKMMMILLNELNEMMILNKINKKMLILIKIVLMDESILMSNISISSVTSVPTYARTTPHLFSYLINRIE